jgi:hypothetical protein
MIPRIIVIDGKAYIWSELVKMRREQLAALKTSEHQPALFELKDDARPKNERKASDRYLQPSLFNAAGGAS